MKKIIILMTVAILGCAPKAKVGDCFYTTDNLLHKVIAVGKYSYEYMDFWGFKTIVLGTTIKGEVDCFDYFDKRRK